MFVVLASRLDSGARALVEQWSSREAALLTCEDLSQPGWRFSPARSSSDAAVVSGSVVPLRRIRGVLVRLQCVQEGELAHVARLDREYVATEMNAFLRCWLATLDCPVLNRPSTGCLSGPSWSQQQWHHAAARAGAQVKRMQVSTRAVDTVPAETEDESVAVTVVGSRCVGTARADVVAVAQRLAASAGVALLSAHFDADQRLPTFLRADPFPPLGDGEVTDLVLDALLDDSRDGGARERTSR